MFCKTCGNKLIEGKAFCPKCGTPTGAASASAQAEKPVQQAVSQLSPTPQATQAAQVAQATPHASRKTVPNAETYTKRDLKWTFKQTLVGKTSVVLAVDFAIWLIFVVGAVIWLAASGYGDAMVHNLPNLLGSLVLTGVQFATSDVSSAFFWLTGMLIFAISYLAFLFIPCTFIVMVFLNIKERNVVPTRETVEAHREQARFKWSLFYGFLLGIIEALAILIFLVCLLAVISSLFFDGKLSANTGITFFFAVFSIGFAEIRMKYLNRTFRSSEDANEAIINGLLSGKLVSQVPEKYADKLGIAKIVRLLDIGVVGSIKGAVRFMRVVDLRAKMLGFSSFIGSWVSAIVNTCTLGMLIIVVVNLNDVTTHIARGEGIVRVDISAQRKGKPVFEIICIIVFILFAIYFITNYPASA